MTVRNDKGRLYRRVVSEVGGVAAAPWGLFLNLAKRCTLYARAKAQNACNEKVVRKYNVYAQKSPQSRLWAEAFLSRFELAAQQIPRKEPFQLYHIGGILNVFGFTRRALAFLTIPPKEKPFVKHSKKVASAVLKALQESCDHLPSTFSPTGQLKINFKNPVRCAADLGKVLTAFGACSVCLKNRTIGHLMSAVSTVRGGQAALLRMIYGESWESHESAWYQCYRVWRLVPEDAWDMTLPWEYYMRTFDKKQGTGGRPIRLKMCGGSVCGSVWRLKLEVNGRGAYLDVPMEDLPSLFEVAK